ncbi:dihydrofolate reductase [Candidatus Berkelbacteria bacterium]|nr:dihydrofolate reductase [Candidatus Berkelbacteria bacterium]
MIITMIAAIGRNRAIGKDGQIPWDLPDDRTFFRKKTTGKVLILGRNTYESIGRLLPNRSHIILTSDRKGLAPGTIVAHTPEEALAIAKRETAKINQNEIIIGGGGKVYKTFLPEATRIYLTVVEGVFEGDAFFPELDEKWAEVERVHHAADKKHAYAFDFLMYNRKQ